MTKRKTMLVPLVFMTFALVTAETFICKEPGKPLNRSRSNTTKVPLWNDSCHSVTTIDLSGNSIGYIGEGSFRLIQNLTILYLNASGIQNISENAFGGNTCLEELYLQENKLSEFPMKLIQHLPKLRTLSIYSNRFLKINGFSSLNAKLEMLSLGPQQTMLSLDTLDFRHLSNLKVLNLTMMNIVNVPHFHPSSCIKHIDLSSNILDFNANDFENCEHLESISFKACNIDKLVFDLFKSQKNLRKLDLTENPLKSDFHTNYAVIQTLVDKKVQVEVTCLDCSNWCHNIFPTLKTVCNAHEKKYNWCPKQCPQNSAVNNGNKHRKSSIHYTLLIICKSLQENLRLRKHLRLARFGYVQRERSSTYKHNHTMSNSVQVPDKTGLMGDWAEHEGILMVMLIIFITTIIFCKMKGSRKHEILTPEGSSHNTNITYT